MKQIISSRSLLPSSCNQIAYTHVTKTELDEGKSEVHEAKSELDEVIG